MYACMSYTADVDCQKFKFNFSFFHKKKQEFYNFLCVSNFVNNNLLNLIFFAVVSMQTHMKKTTLFLDMPYMIVLIGSFFLMIKNHVRKK